MSDRLFGCIEAGGTRFVLGLIRDDRTILSRHRVPTTTPMETLEETIAFLKTASANHGPMSAIGIASFGPVDVDRRSAGWGKITRTPKTSWTSIDVVGPVKKAFGCPVGFDTDVNAAIMAEDRWGAARRSDVAVYVTVGTGIGGGVIVDGRPVHGSRHAEMGHLLVRRHPADKDFAGICRFHGDCLEGLASGPAIELRFGKSLSELPSVHPGSRIVAYYLGQLVVAQQALLSPQRIIIGGGVLKTSGLLAHIRTEAALLGKGYFGDVDYAKLLVSPGLGDDVGVMGALALAQTAIR